MITRLVSLPSCSGLVSPLRYTRLRSSSPRTIGYGCVLRLSSSNTASSGGKADERPHMFQLEHIQKRLEYTTPFMFRIKLDYTFYTRDAILEDQIFDRTVVGLEQIMYHVGIIGLIARISNYHIRAEPINITKVLEDGTVRLRWRVYYVTYLDVLLRLRHLSPKRLKDNPRWYDGYSVFSVNGEGLVFKATLQKVMPSQSQLKSAVEKGKEIVEKIGVLPGAANSIPLKSAKKEIAMPI